MDFVVLRGRDAVDATECKWRPGDFATRGLLAFRTNYPKGRNYVVSPIEGRSCDQRPDDLDLTVSAPGDLRLVHAT